MSVCKFSERDDLWEEGVNVDETTCRENLAGEEAQVAKKQSGNAGDRLHPRAAVCIAGRLHSMGSHKISLRTLYIIGSNTPIRFYYPIRTRAYLR